MLELQVIIVLPDRHIQREVYYETRNERNKYYLEYSHIHTIVPMPFLLPPCRIVHTFHEPSPTHPLITMSNIPHLSVQSHSPYYPVLHY